MTDEKAPQAPRRWLSWCVFGLGLLVAVPCVAGFFALEGHARWTAADAHAAVRPGMSLGECFEVARQHRVFRCVVASDPPGVVAFVTPREKEKVVLVKRFDGETVAVESLAAAALVLERDLATVTTATGFSMPFRWQISRDLNVGFEAHLDGTGRVVRVGDVDVKDSPY